MNKEFEEIRDKLRWWGSDTNEETNELRDILQRMLRFIVQYADHERDIYNAAIDNAVKAAKDCGDYNPSSYYVEDIEKLKK